MKSWLVVHMEKNHNVKDKESNGEGFPKSSSAYSSCLECKNVFSVDPMGADVYSSIALFSDDREGLTTCASLH